MRIPLRMLFFAFLSAVVLVPTGIANASVSAPESTVTASSANCDKIADGDAAQSSPRSCIGEIVRVDSAARLSATAKGTQPIGVYKCGRWRDHPFVDGYFRDCARFSRMRKRFDIDHQAEFHNKFWRQSVEWRCRHSRTTTWTFSVSATVKAEAGVIFAKAEVSATAGVERSVSSTDAADFTFKVGPRKFAWCKRGGYEYKIRGNVRTQFKKTKRGQIYWWRGTYEDFSASAPSHTRYIVGPGRLS
jgi:hypothetical protein